MQNNRGTILIADDDEAILDMYSQALAMVGFEVLQAHDGKDALRVAKERRADEKIDLVLLDILMPKMDGFDALKYIRKIDRYERVPVLMLTNLNRPEDMAEAKRLGAEEFLVKVTISPAQLVKKVNQILRHDS